MESKYLQQAKICAEEAHKFWLVAMRDDTPADDRAFARECGNAAWDEAVKNLSLHCTQAHFNNNFEQESTNAFGEMLKEADKRSKTHPAILFIRDAAEFFDAHMAAYVRAYALAGGLLFVGWLLGCWTVTVGQSCI